MPYPQIKRTVERPRYVVLGFSVAVFDAALGLNAPLYLGSAVSGPSLHLAWLILTVRSAVSPWSSNRRLKYQRPAQRATFVAAAIFSTRSADDSAVSVARATYDAKEEPGEGPPAEAVGRTRCSRFFGKKLNGAAAR